MRKLKKILALTLAATLTTGALAACNDDANTAASRDAVVLSVVTSYGANDGNHKNYKAAVKAYETATGDTINDASTDSNEEWKTSVKNLFTKGGEPDVLFFFAGSDSNEIVKSGKVVPIDEIRSGFPDYAGNMKDSMLPVSPADGKQYALPVNGYWEGLYVNKSVVEAAGAKIPDATTTWAEFLDTCQKIKDAGYTPIAVSLAEIPHYWFEFVVFNHTSPATHAELPTSSKDAAGKAWVAGLNDLKELYERGFLPENTLTGTDSETFRLLVNDKAAFVIDGSWKADSLAADAVGKLENFSVTYVPAQNDRKPTDLIAGLSMGYYITRKAWDHPVKRRAAVEFVSAMTTDAVVSTFGVTQVTALKNGTKLPTDADPLNPIQIDALAMTKGATGTAPATADGLSTAQRESLFHNIPNVVTGQITAEDALEEALRK